MCTHVHTCVGTLDPSCTSAAVHSGTFAYNLVCGLLTQPLHRSAAGQEFNFSYLWSKGYHAPNTQSPRWKKLRGLLLEIEKEYMERAENVPNAYNYVAWEDAAERFGKEHCFALLTFLYDLPAHPSPHPSCLMICCSNTVLLTFGCLCFICSLPLNQQGHNE